jgi:folate-dependent phosphoribosylglycinamide formyltransferase PurN
MRNKKIVILAIEDISTNVVYNALHSEFSVAHVIIERKENLFLFLKRRIRKLGLLKVAGQVMFQLLIVKFLDWISAKRKREIIQEYKLNISQIPADKILNVNSVNEYKTLKLLQEINPDIIIVCGTRIISSEIINGVSAKFINAHAGITPKYRGVHGAYWALVNNDKQNVGVTVHFIDSGIDTGGIICQETVQTGSKDNFVTYPLLQLAKSVELLKKAIRKILNNEVTIIQGGKESLLWYHPTIWGYCYYRIVKKVK